MSSFTESLKEKNEKDQKQFLSEKNIHKCLKKISMKNLIKLSNLSNLNFSVCIMSIYGNLNVGTIMRTSQLCGVNKFIIFGRKRYDKRSTTGAHHYVNIIYNKKKKSDKEEFIDLMNDNNLVPVFIEQTKNSILFSNIKWNQYVYPIEKKGKQICFVFGNEGKGIPKNILDTKKDFDNSFVITIPQLGVSKSFNVSASASLILYNFTPLKI